VSYDALNFDLDLRLLEAWREVEKDMDIELTGAIIRLAYAIGYMDALSEEVPGGFALAHGFRVPTRPAAGEGGPHSSLPRMDASFRGNPSPAPTDDADKIDGG
jgi:hypothetical protein